MKILVIEDDELIAHALLSILTSQNYAVEIATNGQSGWELVEAFDYDLVMLDVMLPKLDGISLCRQMRGKGLQMPILLLTGRDSGHDKAIGLDAGADDYVVKPFDEEELVARVRALLRRGGTISQPILEWGGLRLDPGSCEVTYRTQLLSLTPKEYALLELFLRNKRRVFSCGMILEHLWAYEEMPGEEAVRTHIKGLRQKLRAVGLPGDVVETVYGIGYRLKPKVAEENEAEEPIDLKPKPVKSGDSQHPAPPTSTQLASPVETTQQQTLASIAQIWHKFKDRVSEQVGVLEQMAAALSKTELDQAELDRALWQQARQEAHTLAGSLGTFGLADGSHLARQIEKTLQTEHPLNQDEAANLREWVMSIRQAVERSRSVAGGESRSAAPAPFDPPSAEINRSFLLIVTRDRALAEQLVVEAANWGFQAEIAPSLTKSRDQLRLASPDVVLLDPAIAPVAAESLSLLTELNKQVPPIPVVIFSDHYDLADRLELARLGGRKLIQKSTPLPQVLESINQVLHQADRAKANVMVVDDDPLLLGVVRSLLEPWGLKITTLTNPQQFWEVLEATSPDLLILDIEIPQISGIELCQIVRNDSRWDDLPILFLTAHADAETVNQVFAVGADDFVSKPIVGPELVTRIINRLERHRLIRQLAKANQSSPTVSEG
jgi:DNA-binding response OmpR family regulator